MIGQLVQSIRHEATAWYRSFLAAMPGDIGCSLRNSLYGYKAQAGCHVLKGVLIYFPDRLKLGRNVHISSLTQINAAGGIEIGDDALIGPGCAIWSVNHRYHESNVPIRLQGFDAKPVVIERDCWIAAHVIILPGTHIGAGSIVAAGAVVSRSWAPGSILAGIPAKCIGTRSISNV